MKLNMCREHIIEGKSLYYISEGYASFRRWNKAHDNT